MHYLKLILKRVVMARILLILLCFISALQNVNSQLQRNPASSLIEDDIGIHTEYVDKHNETILKMFNLTEAQMNRIHSSNGANDKNSSSQHRDSKYFDSIKEYRLKDIRNRLQSAFQVGNSEEGQEYPLHEMAAYPMCGTESNESSWMHDNNVTIQFSDSLFGPKRDNLSLDSAILRLYKVKPNDTMNNEPYGTTATPTDATNTANKAKLCAEPLLESQIRVTVSIVQQLRRNKRERKKRICNTIMMNISKTGWVEIDIKRAIYIWENVERQQQQQQQMQRMQQTTPRQPSILVGWLMIEVHDEEERPLKPGIFFQPPKCDQADLAIPWNYYRPHAVMPTYTEKEVPRYPRLDVKLIGYASFAPRNYNKQQQQKLRDNILRQLYNIAKQPAAADDDIIDTTPTSANRATPTAENLLETSAYAETQSHTHTHRKRHLHRATHHHQRRQHLHHGHHGHERSSNDYSSSEKLTHSTDYVEHAHRHRRQPQQQQQQQQDTQTQSKQLSLGLTDMSF